MSVPRIRFAPSAHYWSFFLLNSSAMSLGIRFASSHHCWSSFCWSCQQCHGELGLHHCWKISAEFIFFVWSQVRVFMEKEDFELLGQFWNSSSASSVYTERDESGIFSESLHGFGIGFFCRQGACLGNKQSPQWRGLACGLGYCSGFNNALPACPFQCLFVHVSLLLSSPQSCLGWTTRSNTSSSFKTPSHFVPTHFLLSFFNDVHNLFSMLTPSDNGHCYLDMPCCLSFSCVVWALELMNTMCLMTQRVGCLGGTRAVMKRSTQFLPVIGWSMWFSEYVFLARNWTVDEQTLKVRIYEY